MDLPSSVALARAVEAFGAEYLSDADEVAVALSGGADSLALTAAAVAAGWRVTALIVDHGLQPGSHEVAVRAGEQAEFLGCAQSQILSVKLGTSGGIEAAARGARYAALAQARAGRPVLVGHTLDDQAETVLLGLGRGSGARSIAGMRPWDDPWGRPLLGMRRAQTRSACSELGVVPWDDPFNDDSRFVRVRLRGEVLPLLEEVLGGGVASALARTAISLREDGEALDHEATAVLASIGGGALKVSALRDLHVAIRRRVIRLWLLGAGAENLNDNQIRAVDALVGRWHGQGGVAVGAALPYQRLVVNRLGGELVLIVQDVHRDDRPD